MTEGFAAAAKATTGCSITAIGEIVASPKPNQVDDVLVLPLPQLQALYCHRHRHRCWCQQSCLSLCVGTAGGDAREDVRAAWTVRPQVVPVRQEDALRRAPARAPEPAHAHQPGSCPPRVSMASSMTMRRRVCHAKLCAFGFLTLCVCCVGMCLQISAATRVRNACAYGTHKFFNERGFMYIHTPIVTTSDCEGAGEMFQVTTLMPADPKVCMCLYVCPCIYICTCVLCVATHSDNGHASRLPVYGMSRATRVFVVKTRTQAHGTGCGAECDGARGAM